MVKKFIVMYTQVLKTANTTKVSYTFKKLKRGTTYYVRVRAYNMNTGTKVYGKYSAVKKIKVKK